MGTLYVVGTPIGNLEDLTLRASRILGEVDLIAGEDTRITRKLLSHLGLHTPLVSYHEQNQHLRTPQLLGELQSKDIAMVTDAGMPGISDPGAQLVSRAAAAGFKVEIIPGPSAVPAALAASGFSGDAFIFLGFLPRRSKERRAILEKANSLGMTMVLFEAPHRLKATLVDLYTVLGDRQIAVCREITKLYEEVFRGTAAAATEYFESPRGEFVLVISGASAKVPGEVEEISVEEARRWLQELKAQGVRGKEAVATVVQFTGLPKRTVYSLWIQAGKDS